MHARGCYEPPYELSSIGVETWPTGASPLIENIIKQRSR